MGCQVTEWTQIGTTDDGLHYWDQYDAAYRETLINKIYGTIAFTTRSINEEAHRLMFGVGQAQLELLYRVNEHAQGRGHLLNKPNHWKGL